MMMNLLFRAVLAVVLLPVGLRLVWEELKLAQSLWSMMYKDV